MSSRPRRSSTFTSRWISCVVGSSPPNAGSNRSFTRSSASASSIPSVNWSLPALASSSAMPGANRAVTTRQAITTRRGRSMTRSVIAPNSRVTGSIYRERRRLRSRATASLTRPRCQTKAPPTATTPSRATIPSGEESAPLSSALVTSTGSR